MAPLGRGTLGALVHIVSLTRSTQVASTLFRPMAEFLLLQLYREADCAWAAWEGADAVEPKLKTTPPRMATVTAAAMTRPFQLNDLASMMSSY